MTELAPPVSLTLAFTAGVVSFLSPCVAPLVPGYLAYLFGASVEKLESPGWGQMLYGLAATSLFVLGFTAVFVSLGTSASLLGSLFESYQREMIQVSGGVMVFMGILLTGLIPIPFFNRELRFHGEMKGMGLLKGVPLGMAFGLGWTPCIGPILASILFYASATETVAQGSVLLLVYSLGLGLSFIITGLFFSRALKALRWLIRYRRHLNIASGAILIGIGLLFLTNNFFYISLATQRFFYQIFAR